MQRTTPPFRADHVGSLLRPPALKEARAKRERNEITAEALRAVEDREIEKAIKKQEEIGLKLATDGEFRRSWWHFDFFRGLDGVTFYATDAIKAAQAADSVVMAESCAVSVRASARPPIVSVWNSASSRWVIAVMCSTGLRFTTP